MDANLGHRPESRAHCPALAKRRLERGTQVELALGATQLLTATRLSFWQVSLCIHFQADDTICSSE